MTDPVGNLPSEISTFIGRRRELVLGKELLSSTRLLTLTGTGGIGKTRLARRLAADTSRAFPDGVWLVELADIQRGGFVAATLAAPQGLRSQAVDPMTQLTNHLADKNLLLVLDNCEHLVDECAAVVTGVLSAAPHLRVLATSRHVLGVPGEQVYPVPPMSVSPFTGAPAGGSPDADSVTLFVNRGRAANPDFTITAANSETISQICRRLEGVPLAIELAAVRLRTLTEDQILARLDQALDLLVVGPRSTPERQQRIEATIDWSYRLCTPAEQRLWRGLSVFAGGVTLEALEELGAEANLPANDLLEALDGLVEKSIVTRTESGGAARFHLLEVLRQFGHRQLSSVGEVDAVHLAHLRHFERLAARGPHAYCSADDFSWMDEVRREQANIRVGLEYALSAPESVGRAMTIAVDLKPYWTHTGFLQEGYEWLGRAVEAGRDGRTADLLNALSARADLGLLLAQTEPSLEMLAECHKLAASLPEDELAPRLQAQIAFVEVLAAFFSDGPGRALEIGTEATRLAREVEADDPGVTGQTLAIVCICAFLAGDARAEELTRDSLAMTERHGARLLRAVAVWTLGLCRWRAGDVVASEAHLTEALDGYDEFDSQGLVGSAAETLGWTAALVGEHDRAAVLFGFVDRVREVAKLNIAQNITDLVGATVRADVRRHLGERAWQEAVQRGRELSRAEGVALARRRKPSRAHETASQAKDKRREAAGAALTKRESEVARLVADGLSNKEIAERLVISVRTAEAHVENILVKLNLNSRTQVAAWFSGQAAEAR